MEFTTLRFAIADDTHVAPLRRLVNTAYRGLAEMGLNFTGTYQDEALTRERMQGKEVHLLYLAERLVGTVSLEDTFDDHGERILYLGQLAVLPAWQSLGLGRVLMRLAENRAQEMGIRRIQLDTAVPALHLVGFYQSEGYVIVETVHWEGKTYQSYIMEKTLPL